MYNSAVLCYPFFKSARQDTCRFETKINCTIKRYKLQRIFIFGCILVLAHGYEAFRSAIVIKNEKDTPNPTSIERC